MFNLGRTSLRLSLKFAFLYSVLSAIIFAGAYWFTEYEVRNWLHAQMAADTEVLIDIYEQSGVEEMARSVNLMAAVNFENDRIFQLQGPDGEVLGGNLLQINGPITEQYIAADSVEVSGDTSDEISGYWIIQNAVGPYILLQGTGNHVLSEVLEAMSITLVTGIILIMALGSFAGVWVGRLTERQIASISGALGRVADGQLSARIPIIDAPTDDLSRVAVSINGALEQLENLMESQIQISNDIAHDLRTPLQRLRQRLEKMTRQRVVDPEEAEIALTQTEDIIDTFNALLRIAQLEAGDRRERFQTTDLRSIVTNVHEAFEPSAEDAGQLLLLEASEEPVLVSGDPDLLMQLVSNLVENALRHTPEGTEISLEATHSNSHPVLRVSDNGPGIAHENYEKVFRRFYRGEKSRTTGGNGLGLSLCKAIADLHHAELKISDNNPGLRIEAHFANAE
ncbi:sensor histidine kinase [Celeribacter litoreus]|uniref:sensor histidine kinase n=1 Tax=Celeribacter litoreus TaxID=2876714 RepID=UPI001CCE9062|nr:ATP-binding protein [Celeribacter litoreus]MCA0042002.1 sensor histidine kinase [Celeribacter litoreus]